LAAAAIAAGLVAGALAGCARRANPTAAEIVAKNVAARGGLEAWRKVETMIWRGRIESARAPVPELRFELAQKRPNRTRLQLRGLGARSVRAFDGVRGWKTRPGHGWAGAGVAPYTQQELVSAQTGHGIDGPLITAAAKGTPVALEGLDQIEGRRAYHLRVDAANGESEEVWVDAETYLDVRYDRTVQGLAGAPRRVSTSYGDFRTVEGLKLPFLVTTGGGPGVSPDRMQIEAVVLNAPLDDTIFENPAAARPGGRAPASVAARASASAEAPPAPAAPNEER
jgi:hypothetical protein